MLSAILPFTIALAACLALAAVVFRTSDKTTRTINRHISEEYNLHACGRAVSAIFNFNMLSRSKLMHELASAEQIEVARDAIEKSIKDRYGKPLLIIKDKCVNPSTGEALVKVYLRNSDHVKKDIPNYSYRILTPVDR